MNDSTIICPQCQTTFPLTAAIAQPIVDRLRSEFESEAAKREEILARREKELAAKKKELETARESVAQELERRLGEERTKIVTEQEKKAKEAVTVRLSDLEQQLAEKNKKLLAAQQGELALLKQKRDLEEQKEAFEIEKAKQIEAERNSIRAEATKAAVEAEAVKLQELKEMISAKDRKLAEAQQGEIRLRKEQASFEEQKSAFELEKMKQIEAEREKIREEARRAALEVSAAELIDLKEKLSIKDRKLLETQDAELKLRKQKTEFEEEKRSFELQLARSKEEIRDTIKKEKDEEFRLKEAEKNKQMEDLKRQIDEMKRKAEQGSQQAQGEILELDLEAALRRCFAGDEIFSVPKGAHGGDVLQHVKDEAGNSCGTIIWESKRTKAWSDQWLGKLKDDQLVAKAQLAILVSVTMPRDLASFECRERVWITPPNLAVPLAAALRLGLIETGSAKRATEGRHDKMEVVYDYLSGPEFKGRVTTIVEALSTMREDLDSERKAVQKIWAKREKQLERVMSNVAGMHGDLSGIIGQSLPAIEKLELAALVAEPENAAEIVG